MNRFTRMAPIAATALLLLSARWSVVHASPAGTIIIPLSSIEMPGDIGKRAHTNIQLLVPVSAMAATPATAAGPAQWLPMHENATEVAPLLPPFSGYLFETPASLGCIYKLTSTVGCNPNVVTAVPTGGSKLIAIVDAFDDPTALSDLQHFSTQFGLTPVNASNFQVVFATGTRPPVDPTGGWEGEEALDVEMAHAMAPAAHIILVEAKSNSFTDLFAAEDAASNRVAAAGGGEVSNSWGGSEFSGEATLDSHFKKPTVVYFASTGDNPGVEYPATSPFVVAAGGTATTHNLTTGLFQKEVAWQVAGSGTSALEPRPAYQAPVASIVGTHRGTPDISSDSDITTGVWVFVTPKGPSTAGWYIFGGTSVASPTIAGIVNSAGHFYINTTTELTVIYNHRTTAAAFRDIVFGNCGPYGGLSTLTGYDLCTGVGSDQGKLFK